MTRVSNLFPRSYAASRARFRRGLDLVQRQWPDARLDCYRLAGDEDLTIDWIEAQALERSEKLLMITTGTHGIEGDVGSAVLQLFIEEFLPELTPEDTALLLVHAVNPWGMAHRRRTNRRNVDLNRNFIRGRGGFDPSSNPDYALLEPFLNPKKPVQSLLLSDAVFVGKLFWHLVRLGPKRVRAATFQGQYRFPKGLCFGGPSLREEAGVVVALCRRLMRKTGHVVHLDLHSGFGPRYQMTVVNSPLEPRSSRRLERLFSYPLVVKADADELYSAQGELTTYLYTLVHKEFPNKRLYATSLEFGTYGDTFLASLRSLRTLILENQIHWFGVGSERVQERVARAFEELFCPNEETWRAKAVTDARQALYGILLAEGFIPPREQSASHAS